MKITPSKAGAFLECPSRYYFTYVDRAHQTGGPWARLSLGNSLHRALAAWVEAPPGERIPESADQHLRHCWDSGGYRDRDQEVTWIGHARRWLREYTERPEVRAAVVRGNERTVVARWRGPGRQDIALEGRVDRIDERPDGFVVVDYKTGHTAPTDDDAAVSPALALYCWAASQMFRTRVASAELHHLPSGVVATVTYTPERILRHVARIAAIASDAECAEQTFRDMVDGGSPREEMANELFPARVGPLCGSCSFRHLCEPGRTVPAVESWAHLREPETQPAKARQSD